MTGHQKTGLLGVLLGSPFALLGLIFLLRGKVGLGISFLLLGLGSVASGTAVRRRAGTPTTDCGDQSAELPGGNAPESEVVRPTTSHEGVRRSLGSLAVALACVGCAGGRPQLPASASVEDLRVSSVQSDWVLWLTTSGALRTEAEGFVIDLPHLVVHHAGRMPTSEAIAFGNVSVRALLAEPRDDAWSDLVQSDAEVPVSSLLRQGDSAAVGPIRLRLPRPPRLDATRTWIVFQIAADEIAPGSASPGRAAKRVTVYACAPRTLSGGSLPPDVC